MNIRLLLAFERIWSIHHIPILAINWKSDLNGELIDDKLPLLLVFFNQNDEVSSVMHPVLKDVAAAMGDKGKVIKTDTKNNLLNLMGTKTVIFEMTENKFCAVDFVK